MSDPLHLAIPFALGQDGLWQTVSEEDRIRQLLEQVLLTRQGERVNRPTFGAGVDRMVFEPANEAAVGALVAGVRAQLQAWLGDLVRVEDVRASFPAEGVVRLDIRYLVAATQTRGAHSVMVG